MHHGFECRAVAFATARHHRRGSAVKHSLVRNSRGGNRPKKFEIRQLLNFRRQAKLLAFLFVSVCGLARKECTQTKKHATQLSSVSSEVWELTDSNRRPSACKADALNQLS